MNHKTFQLLAWLFSLVLIAGVAVTPALAQQPGFTERFDDPQLPGWEHSPEVIVAGGLLRIAPANFAARMGAWQEFDLTLTLRYSGDGETQIEYCASETGNYQLLLSTHEAILRRSSPPMEPVEIAHGTLPAEGDQGFELRINLSGGRHAISADGAPLLTADDPNPLPPGMLVLASHGRRITEVDDVVLTVPRERPEPAAGPVSVPPTSVPTATPVPTSWQVLLNTIASGQGSRLELDTVLLNLVLAVVTSFILSRVYVHWGASLSNRRKFASNLPLVTVTTTFIILVVRSSVALSLGLVGALSIIRFRAAIKEPEELAYLFFAISLGIGLGDNQRAITLLAMVVVVALVGLARVFRHTQADVNLHLTIASRFPKAELPAVMKTLESHCSRLRLLRYDETEEALEISFVVEFRQTADLARARAALQALSPTMEISFLDNKGVW